MHRYLLTLLLLLTYRRLVLGGLDFTAGYQTDSVFNNIGTALRHLWFFIEQALLPSEPVISDAWPVTHAWGSVEVAALLGLLLIIGATVIGLRLHHPSAFGAAWFLLWLLPGLGMFPSDHYHTSQTLYLAVWGVAFAASYGLFRLWRPIGRQMVPGSEAVVFVPLILILGVITGLSNVRWWDHAALFESEIASDPHYIEGRLQLAAAALEDGEAAIALNHGLAAVEAARDTQFTGYWSARDAYFLLGAAQSQMGLDHEATGSFATALEARPGDAQLLYRLGLAQLFVALTHLHQGLGCQGTVVSIEVAEGEGVYPQLLSFYEVDTEAEQILYDMFMDHRMKTFQGAFHINPDYTTWYGYAKMKQDLAKIREIAKKMRNGDKPS